MLCRMIARKKKTGTVPVYLNVYDLTPINGYAYWVGLGVYHSGVQVANYDDHVKDFSFLVWISIELVFMDHRVCALLSGGVYAEKVAVPAGQVLPISSGISLKDAASFPEVACTVWSTVFMTSKLSPGETFLIHGGSSGIGTFAIQMAKYLGINVFVTAGSEEKLNAYKEIGADVGINYKTEDFVARVKVETGGKGVDVILDNIGGSYFHKNLEILAIDGRLFIIGFMGGVKTEANISLFLQGVGLRTRSLEKKPEISRLQKQERVTSLWKLVHILGRYSYLLEAFLHISPSTAKFA